MRYTLLALVIAVMATPVYAQFSPNLAGEGVKLKTDADVKAERDREAGYRSGVNKIPDGKAKSDPWAGVRGAAPAPAQNQSRSSAK